MERKEIVTAAHGEVWRMRGVARTLCNVSTLEQKGREEYAMYIFIRLILAVQTVVYKYVWWAGTNHVHTYGPTILATPPPAAAFGSPRRGKVLPARRAATRPSIRLWMWPLGPYHAAEGGRERWGSGGVLRPLDKPSCAGRLYSSASTHVVLRRELA